MPAKTAKAPDQEQAVLLSQGIVVTLAGAEYTMRRLTTRDVFDFGKYLSAAAKSMEADALGDDADAFGFGMLAALGETMYGWYAGLLGMSPEEFMNQSPEFLADFLDALEAHYDIAGFFKIVQKAVKNLGSIW